MKSRFTTLDLMIIIQELKSKLINLRVNNIYDCNNKTYLIKFQKPDVKEMLLIESGIRLHTTKFDWPKNNIPNGFSMKLRKHLKGKRLVNIDQINQDRIVYFQFGEGEVAFYLIIELYDKGNLVLCDHTFRILHLGRIFSKEDSDVNIRTGEIYKAFESKLNVKNEGDKEVQEIAESETIESVKEDSGRDSPGESVSLISKIQANPKENVMRILNHHLNYGANAIQHILQKYEFLKPRQLLCETLINSGELDQIQASFQNLNTESGLSQELGPITPIITYQNKPNTDIEGNTTFLKVYQDFYTHQFNFTDSLDFDTFENFNAAVDEYFSEIKKQKEELDNKKIEKNAVKKLTNAKKNHEKQIEKLVADQNENRNKAELVEMNLELVEKALLIVNSMVANQLDWSEIENLLNEAKLKNDMVANSITSLKLSQNKITMLLFEKTESSESEDSLDLGLSDSDEEESKPVKKLSKPGLKVDLDLALSVYGNISALHSNKKTAIIKEQKTVDAGKKALKSAELKAKKIIKQTEKIQNIRKSRKSYWFEKFNWFITSENYICIAGKDAQQNEMIVKKYLKNGDAYIHADIHGAATVILKNHSKIYKLPEKSLIEAGNFALINSSAWDAKIVSDVYWVNANQVSKTAQSGEYLSTGSFMIRGKKNYLGAAVQNLTVGFGFLFKLDEDSLSHHKNERSVNENVEMEFLPDGEKILQGQQKIEEEVEQEAKQLEEMGLKSDSESEVESDQNLPVSPPQKSQPKQDLEIEEKEDDFEFPETNLINNIRRAPEKKSRSLPAWKQIELEKKQNNAKKNQDQVRGKKGKNKKIKNKYKDQDEEDRQAVIQMINASGEYNTNENSKKNKRRNKNRVNQKSTSQPAASKVVKNAVVKKLKEEAGPTEEVSIQLEKVPEKANSTTNSSVPQPKASTYEKVEDPDDFNLNSDFTYDLFEMNDLTSQPKPDDTIHFAIPIAAPYSTMHNYKFKVKMQPGTTKKGKAARTALNIFLNEKGVTPYEKDLMNAVNESELFKNLPGKVKLVNTGNLSGKKR